MEEKDPYFIEKYRDCYIAHGTDLRRFVYRFTRDPVITEDLVHDVFLKLLERKTPLDLETVTTRAFLFVVAKNLCLDFLRRKKTEEVGFKKMIVKEVELNERFYRDVEDMYLEGEVISTMYDTINRLPEKKREIFIKKALHDKKIREIMKEMHVSSFVINKTVKEVMCELRVRLRKLVNRE